ncbi:hypothetical protein H6P81_003442 [Aristolochia fimbriata]|uniref:TTF-type domain-containing protein n=1 Tax=Aristolochia fimbriata TaxID=158543 RepID=A0AAV7FEH5_ARIFI|nr:hypothetical protein H6P81_003442 [Aristolochia fimbriata]
MRKQTTIDAIFKRKEPSTSNNSVYSAQTSSQIDSHEIEATILEPPPPNVNTTEVDISIRVHHHSKIPRIESTGEDTSYKIMRDPGLLHSIWDFSSEKQDEIRRAYLMAGPYQPILNVYPSSGPENHRRRFQASWFKLFHWLEYSTDKDSAYCLPCYLFTRPDGRPGSDVFITRGFDKWKKVNDGKSCAFLGHMGKDHNSQHNKAEKACLDLMNQAYHIQNVFKRQSTQEVLHNRLRLKTSVDVIRWLTFQACPFRGHDESLSSQNRGNFLEMVKLLASYNEQVSGVVLGNAPQNAKYTSPDIQKEILHVIANKVRNTIRSEIGEAKFCIIVDEARDESKREQMAIVLRFVDKKGLIRMFNSVRSVLSDITIGGSTYAQRGDADAAYNMKMREDGWNSFFGQVLSFCRKNEISIPDMSSNYAGSRGRSRRQKDPLIVEHHYRIEVFLAGLDSQLQELNTRFSDHTMDLLIAVHRSTREIGRNPIGPMR